MLEWWILGTILFGLGICLFSNRVNGSSRSDQQQAYALWCGVCAIATMVCASGAVLSLFARALLS